jgi:hypothetical protein
LFVPSYHYLKLTISYHAAVIAVMERLLHCRCSLGCNGAAEPEMKIYLLMTIIGTLLTAVHFTSAPEQRSKQSHDNEPAKA